MSYENNFLCHRKLWHHILLNEHFHKRGVERGVIFGWINGLLYVLSFFFVISHSYGLVELAGAPPFPPPFFEKCFFQKYGAWAISRTKNHPFRLSGCWDRPANFSREKRAIFHSKLIFSRSGNRVNEWFFVDFEVPIFSGLYVNEKWR